MRRVRIAQWVPLRTERIGRINQFSGSYGSSQLRAMLPDHRTEVDINPFHVPLHVEKPFWARALMVMLRERMHGIFATRYTTRVENRIGRRWRQCWFPIGSSLLEVLRETKTKSSEWARTDDGTTWTSRDCCLIQCKDQKISTFIHRRQRRWRRQERVRGGCSFH